MAFRNKARFHQLPVIRVLLIQAFIIVGLMFAFLLLKGFNAGYSALLGGGIALLPNIYFTLKAFRYFGARSALAVTLSLWTGEAGKYALTIALFALVFWAVKPLDLIALFVSYIFVLIVSSVGLLLVKNVSK